MITGIIMLLFYIKESIFFAPFCVMLLLLLCILSLLLSTHLYSPSSLFNLIYVLFKISLYYIIFCGVLCSSYCYFFMILLIPIISYINLYHIMLMAIHHT